MPSLSTSATPTVSTDPATFALAPGFRTAATACGLKTSGRLDLGFAWSERPCAAAGVFTTNRVQAAPVDVCRESLAAAAGRMRGVLYNSGCANAVTGERGLADARRMRALGAAAEDVALTCHAHPTVSEAVREAVSAAVREAPVRSAAEAVAPPVGRAADGAVRDTMEAMSRR